MIEASDLPGVPGDLANQVISAAVAIAPCIDSFPKDLEGDPRRERAVSVLRGVAKFARSRGSATVKAQRAGSASVDYGDSGSWFSDDDRNSLAALCAGCKSPAGLPVGRFPKPGVVSRVWPEVMADGA